MRQRVDFCPTLLSRKQSSTLSWVILGKMSITTSKQVSMKACFSSLYSAPRLLTLSSFHSSNHSYLAKETRLSVDFPAVQREKPHLRRNCAALTTLSSAQQRPPYQVTSPPRWDLWPTGKRQRAAESYEQTPLSFRSNIFPPC